jgi:hypothetical protein
MLFLLFLLAKKVPIIRLDTLSTLVLTTFHRIPLEFSALNQINFFTCFINFCKYTKFFIHFNANNKQQRCYQNDKNYHFDNTSVVQINLKINPYLQYFSSSVI